METVLTAEAAHIEMPLALCILLGNHIRHTMFGNHPHGVDMILGNAHDTRAQQPRVHVEHVLFVGLGIHHTATCCGAMPYQSTTILHDTGGGGHGSRLTFDGRNLDVDHLAIDRIDE